MLLYSQAFYSSAASDNRHQLVLGRSLGTYLAFYFGRRFGLNDVTETEELGWGGARESKN
jgi:predicted esterase YcpF (UPF0227 family)